MGFHLLTYSNPKSTKVTGGMGLTYPTLAAFVKYPRPSFFVDKDRDKVSEKNLEY
jgi:dGTP triphosphohydrolase